MPDRLLMVNRHKAHLLLQLVTDLPSACLELRTHRLPQRCSDLAGSLIEPRSICKASEAA